jgi:23S rRNA pseudouridine1911/1915/1917 synthase
MNDNLTLLTLTVGDEAKQDRIDRWLAETCADHHTVFLQTAEDEAASPYAGLSRSRLKTLILDGQLRINGVISNNPSLNIQPGMVCELTLPEPVSAIPQAEDIPLDVLFEDEHLIIINKPAGMVVHPAPGSMQGTLVNALIAHCGDSLTGIGGEMRPGIVHRLDKDTSGVMVAAKTAITHQRLSVMFAEHDLTRQYTALVWGLLKERNATIDAPIGRNTRDRKKMAVLAKGRDAITHIHAARVLPPLASVVECVLETGRTHQIRVHMAHIGHGVIGDPSYGRAMRASQMPDQALRDALAGLRAFPRQALHASHLGFDHPITGKALGFDTPLPADMEALIKQLEDAIAKRGKAKSHT